VQHLIHHQQRRQVHDHLNKQLIGEGFPEEGNRIGDSHRIVRRFNLVLPVGDVEDPITSVTTQSYK
jgi:hypothetical protein